MMKHKNFAAFILTHGRPGNVLTFKTLKKSGYTGKVYIVIDNEDPTAPEYKKKFGKRVIVFDKKAISETFDEGDNFEDRRAIVYARNACFAIAKEMGIKNFVQLDDDYYEVSYKFTDKGIYKQKNIKNLDGVFDAFLNYFLSTKIDCLAMAQCGDFIGGAKLDYVKKRTPKRKAMNTLFCTTDRPFQFVGRINEDVNTYTSGQSKGLVFLTSMECAINQLATQKNAGGMTDLYLDSGTYIKSFYSVMYSPSSVKIRLMGAVYKRLHHSVKWNSTVPKIISEKFKKI